MMREQCKTCVSGIKGQCTLGINKYLGKYEQCGSYGKLYIDNKEISDYNYEYGYVKIDKLTDMWLEGKDIDEFGLDREF